MSGHALNIFPSGPGLEPAHGVEDICWNAAAEGWQIACMCGWNSGASKYLERIGQEFDQHMREEGVLK